MTASQDPQRDPASPSKKWPVHIEVCVSPKSTARLDSIRALVLSYITSSIHRITLPSALEGWNEVPGLAASVERICASECAAPSSSLCLDEMQLQIHVYQPCSIDDFEEFNDGGNGDDNDVGAANVCELPNRSFEGLWDSLIYADDIKTKLLDYIYATMIMSDANVDFNLVSWNRVVLLHGPPGTGKTSLCRALAHKLSIRLSHRYPRSRLLDINSHSLFSRWFSESGKLVQRLFSGITEMLEEEDIFTVVLIDEVESLTAARAGAMAGTEPSDGLRVVNALLTQLDKLKHRKNVLVMSTSNLVKAIDCAFVDRADIIQYVDLPPREAIYGILRTCLCELIAKRIIANITVPSIQEALIHERLFSPLYTASSSDATTSAPNKSKIALRLLELAAQCREQGMSGRALRRLPVLALARYISLAGCLASQSGTGQSFSQGSVNDGERGVDVDVWLAGMEKVVRERGAELGRLI